MNELCWRKRKSPETSLVKRNWCRKETDVIGVNSLFWLPRLGRLTPTWVFAKGTLCGVPETTGERGICSYPIPFFQLFSYIKVSHFTWKQKPSLPSSQSPRLFSQLHWPATPAESCSVLMASSDQECPLPPESARGPWLSIHC